MTERHRFDVIDQEQLAAQLVAVMNAHFQRPQLEEKLYVLRLATQQVCAGAGESSQEALLLFSSHHSSSR